MTVQPSVDPLSDRPTVRPVFMEHRDGVRDRRGIEAHWISCRETGLALHRLDSATCGAIIEIVRVQGDRNDRRRAERRRGLLTQANEIHQRWNLDPFAAVDRRAGGLRTHYLRVRQRTMEQ